MRHALIACALAAFAPAAFAQIDKNVAPPPKTLQAEPTCGVPASPTSLYGFALLMTIQQVKDTAFCISKNKYTARTPTKFLVPYRDDLHAPQRYFDGVQMTVSMQPPSPAPEEFMTLRFVGHGDEAKLVYISIMKRARSTVGFDVDTEKRLLLTQYPGQSFVSRPPEVTDPIVMGLTPANVPITEKGVFGMCYIAAQSKACGANIKLTYEQGLWGMKKPVKEFTARLTYGSKVFPAILATQETDAAGRPLPPKTGIAPPVANH